MLLVLNVKNFPLLCIPISLETKFQNIYFISRHLYSNCKDSWPVTWLYKLGFCQLCTSGGYHESGNLNWKNEGRSMRHCWPVVIFLINDWLEVQDLCVWQYIYIYILHVSYKSVYILIYYIKCIRIYVCMYMHMHHIKVYVYYIKLYTHYIYTFDYNYYYNNRKYLRTTSLVMIHWS